MFVETLANCKAKRDDTDGRRGGFCYCGMFCELGEIGEGTVEVDVQVN
jgi:hypothetical protein